MVYEPSFENKSVISKGKNNVIDEKCRIPINIALGDAALINIKSSKLKIKNVNESMLVPL